jgi:hypothetical protein
LDVSDIGYHVGLFYVIFRTWFVHIEALLFLEILLGKCLQLFKFNLMARINDNICAQFLTLFSVMVSTLMVGASGMYGGLFHTTFQIMSC